MLSTTDIDIDLLDRDAAVATLPCVHAVMRGPDGKLQKHPSGVYFQDIATDPVSGMAVFDFKETQDLGYFKVDLLSSPIYTGVEDENHLDRLISTEPDWALLESRAFLADYKIYHIHSNFGIVQSIKPTSIEDLAVVIALMRPARRDLRGQPRSVIDAEIWKFDSSGDYAFKRAHAIAFATVIVMQLNLITEQMLNQMIAEEADAEIFKTH